MTDFEIALEQAEHETDALEESILLADWIAEDGDNSDFRPEEPDDASAEAH